MDGIIVILLAVILYLKYTPDTESVAKEEENEVIVFNDLEPTVNLEYYSDEDAFMEVAHELGFY